MKDIIDKADVLIIGAGVIGSCIARHLSQYQLRVALVEKEEDVGFGTSKANSGIVHAGFHDVPGTKKANLCVAGNSMYEKLCSELEVPFKRCGSLVVGLEGQRLGILEELKARGEKNEVPGLKIVRGPELFDLEPNLTRKAKAALFSPTVGVVCPYELTIALAENARQNGVGIFPGTRVKNILPGEDEAKKVETSKGTFFARYVINCAGLFAGDIARMLGEDDFSSILPRKGEEYILDKRTRGLVSHVIFPLPKPDTKGVLIIPTVDGNVMIGPTAKKVKDKDDVATTPQGLEEVLQNTTKLVPPISPKQIIAFFAGLRASLSQDDFIITASSKMRGVFHAAGIDSPGLTAAPGIARMMEELLRDEGLELVPKKDFNPYREFSRFRDLPMEKRKELIKKDRRYASIVCRCENVTEAEIIQAIHKGARTLDGVKFRTRAGMGRCQGGFCTPRVVQIMARELGVPAQKITKRGKGSDILWCKTKRPLGGQNWQNM